MEPPKEGGSFFFQRIIQSGVYHGALRVLNRLKKAGHFFPSIFSNRSQCVADIEPPKAGHFFPAYFPKQSISQCVTYMDAIEKQIKYRAKPTPTSQGTQTV